MLGAALSNGSVPRRRDDLDCYELDSEAIVYDPVCHTTCRLNETGFVIWKYCDGTTDFVGIARRLMERYDVSESRARGDVREFITRMQKEGLLELP